MTSASSAAQRPLVVDLDGTLLRTDLLLETSLAFLRAHPLRLVAPLRWLTRGKAALKHELAHATEIDASVLPYEPAVIRYIEEARKENRQVVLATAAHHHLADQVAAYLGLFDTVIASDGERNLSAGAKRDVLVKRYGDGGFDYVGNSGDDLPVWRAAHRAVVVNAAPAVERRARAQGNVTAVIQSGPSTASDWGRALRFHQWTKNLLVFVPVLAAHKVGNMGAILDVVLAFIAFGLCASSVYLLGASKNLVPPTLGKITTS